MKTSTGLKSRILEPSDSTPPLVSVVTPSYNQGEFIARTIASVLMQDYPNLVYWVIDGGSTDGTLSILENLSPDPRLHWISEPDQGQAHAVQKGWKRSQCEILGWLNSDDIYLPGAVSQAVQALQQYPQAAFVYSNYQAIDRDDHLLRTVRVRQAGFAEQLRLESLIPQQTVFAHRAAVEACGGIDVSLHYALDQELWLRILEKYEGIYVDAIWAAQRVHQDAKTQAAWGRLHEEFYEVVRAYARRPEIPESVIEPALRRTSLEMFILRATQERFGEALDHLAQAVAGQTYPFNSPGETIKHSTYALRRRQGPSQAIQTIERLRDAVKNHASQAGLAGLLNAFLAYCYYQDGSFHTARSLIRQAFQLQPNLCNDRYLAALPTLCAFNGFPVRLRRAIDTRRK